MLDSTPGARLELAGLTKLYGSTAAVDSIDLGVAAGEFVTLLGPSGSGKTTTLNLVAGFASPDAGTIVLDGAPVQNLAPHKRDIGMVFQHYALFPHMTVAENVSFPLRQRRMKRPAIRERVTEVLDLVRLAGFDDRYPRQLSGGQQQRVAVARAIAFRPRLLLMDEPLGALDKNLREALQLEIKRIHEEVRSTFVYVTHDQEEAMALSDRIAIFNHGRIEQVGRPQDLYERPATLFVASFLGETNATSGVLTEEGTITTIDGALTLRASPHSGLPARTLVTLVLRPEQCEIRMPSSPVGEDESALTGIVRQVMYLGSARRVVVEVQRNHSIVVRESAHRPLLGAEGEQVLVAWEAKDAVVLRADGAHLIADDKERRELALDGAIGDG